jgi:hypothetical protein
MKQGDKIAAIELLKLIPDEPEQSDAMHEKIDVLIQAADALSTEDQAHSLRLAQEVQAAVEILKLESAPWVEPHFLLAIGRVLWSLSRKEAAIELWDRAAEKARVSADIDCRKLVGDIALAFVAVGERGRAEQLLPAITLENARLRVLEALNAGLEQQ